MLSTTPTNLLLSLIISPQYSSFLYWSKFLPTSLYSSKFNSLALHHNLKALDS